MTSNIAAFRALKYIPFNGVKYLKNLYNSVLILLVIKKDK